MSKHSYATYQSSIITKPKRGAGRILGRIFGTLLFLIVFGAVCLLAFLTLTEYQPAASEQLEIGGKTLRTLSTDEEMTILTWNIGYGGLSDQTDFIMDGGKDVIGSSEERVKQNMKDIIAEAQGLEPDIALFQEVDIDSWRSYGINEARMLTNSLPNTNSAFAYNYKTAFVPIGIPPYGKIESGIQTISSFPINSAVRSSLPQSDGWPLSTVFLKRAQLITRIPVEGSRHELVIINEHPDAYVSEEIHRKQMDAIIETLQKEASKGNWVIAGGDWNHHFSSIDVSNYPLLREDSWQPGHIDVKEFGEGWQFVMDNTTPTNRLLDAPISDEAGNPTREVFQGYMIDGFIVSSNVRVESVETRNLRFKASDHNPVVIKVLLEKD